MKRIWQLTYETIPGDGEITNTYKSFDEAKSDIRKLITRIDLKRYTDAIRSEDGNPSFRITVADFLNDYITRQSFFTENDILPSDDYESYTADKPKAAKKAIAKTIASLMTTIGMTARTISRTLTSPTILSSLSIRIILLLITFWKASPIWTPIW